MRFVSKILAALLCILLAASPAGSGSMMLLGVGKAGGAALSPVTLTFQAAGIGSNAGSTYTFGTLTLGAAPSVNRRITLLLATSDFVTGTSNTISSVVFTPSAGGTVNADTIIILGSDVSDGLILVSAVLPLGTTSTLTITCSLSVPSAPRFAFYTLDNSTLSSPTSPVTAYNVDTSGVATTVTTTVNTLAGGGLLAFSSNNSTPVTSFSGAVTVIDGAFGNYRWGSASNISAATPASATGTWTGVANPAALALVAYR